MAWKGVIIEESLEDMSLLDMISVEGTVKEYLEEEAKRGKMTLHRFFLDEKRKSEFVRRAKKAVRKGWYIHICRFGTMIVIFRDRSFQFTKNNTDIIRKAEEYGKSMGILPVQMGFIGMIDIPWG